MGRISIVEEPTRKSPADPRREPSGPIGELAPKAGRTAQQKVVIKDPAHAREAKDPGRADVHARTEAPPNRAPVVSRTMRTPGEARLPARDQQQIPEFQYEIEAPRPARDGGNPRTSTVSAREPPLPPPPAGTAGRRYPSQTGAAATSGRLELHCEIDGASATIEPSDLSAAGMFVPSPKPPPIDSEVRVRLRIGGARFEARGHVVQSLSSDAAKREHRRAGFGLLFTTLDDDARGRLRDAIEALARERTERASGAGANVERRQSDPKPVPAVDPKEYELLERLRAELAALQSQPPWTVLGISQSASAERAREAFFAASKRYHPHIYARYVLPEIKDVVTQLFIAHKRAFSSMTKGGRSPRNAAGGRAPGNR